MTCDPVNFLVVDDDDIAIVGLQRAFRKMDIANPFFIASDGVEALELLRGDNGNTPIPKPFLVLLDLNMPRMNGFEFLEEIRNDPNLRRSIVFVLTTSDAEMDKAKAYAHNVAGYIVKSNAATNYNDALYMLDRYTKVVELPC